MYQDNLLPANGEAYYESQFFTQETADNYLAVLKEEIEWQEAKIRMFGKMVKIPRLQAWHGTKKYSYSGLLMEPLPWTATLMDIKDKVEKISDTSYNSVLLNLYSCLLYTSPSPRDQRGSRMPSSA